MKCSTKEKPVSGLRLIPFMIVVACIGAWIADQQHFIRWSIFGALTSVYLGSIIELDRQYKVTQRIWFILTWTNPIGIFMMIAFGVDDAKGIITFIFTFLISALGIFGVPRAMRQAKQLRNAEHMAYSVAVNLPVGIKSSSPNFDEISSLTFPFKLASGIAALGANDVVISDAAQHCLYRMRENQISLFAGIPNQSGWVDGKFYVAQFHQPSSLCVDGTGIVYVIDDEKKLLRCVDINGDVKTIARATDPAINATHFDAIAGDDRRGMWFIAGGALFHYSSTGIVFKLNLPQLSGTIFPHHLMQKKGRLYFTTTEETEYSVTDKQYSMKINTQNEPPSFSTLRTLDDAILFSNEGLICISEAEIVYCLRLCSDKNMVVDWINVVRQVQWSDQSTMIHLVNPPKPDEKTLSPYFFDDIKAITVDAAHQMYFLTTNKIYIANLGKRLSGEFFVPSFN